MLRVADFNRKTFSFQFVAKNRNVPEFPEYRHGASGMVPAKIKPRTIFIKNNEEIILTAANNQEMQKVETMIRDCARVGDGFNLDEFCPDDGHFLCKFILDPKVVIATCSHGNIKGAAVCGFSAVPRVPGAVYSAYFVVKETERRKGIANALLGMVYEMCKAENCNTLLFDVYLNNHVTIAWLKRNGFLVTGCLPHCGYVVNNGHTDALLMTKELDKLSASDVISKL